MPVNRQEDLTVLALRAVMEGQGPWRIPDPLDGLGMFSWKRRVLRRGHERARLFHGGHAERRRRLGWP